MDKPKKAGRKPAIKKTASLLEDLSNFQNEVPILIKNTKGYGYTYVDLAEIMRVITPLLFKHKLVITQGLTSNGLTTTLHHVRTGDKIESHCEIPTDVSLKGMNEFQVMGSAITYYRRYSISSLLGLVADKDTDAQGTQTAKKRTLDDKTFKDALGAISRGEYSVVDLRAGFQLTNTQLKQLPQ